MEVSIFNIKNTQNPHLVSYGISPWDAESPASRDSVRGWLPVAVKVAVKVRAPEQSDADLARCAEQDPLPPEFLQRRSSYSS